VAEQLLHKPEYSQKEPENSMESVSGMIISPTDREIRNDRAGAGRYHAPRSGRLHSGLDFLCFPGQNIVCPISNAEAIRYAYPYEDKSYSGIFLRNSHFDLMIFYFTPADDIFGKPLSQGEVIGTAQDITQRYDSPFMKPHIHMQIDSADPALFLKED